RRAFDVDLRHPGVRQALLQIFAKLQIAMQRLGVVLSRKPTRVPRFVESKPESVRVDLLTQSCLRYFAAARARRGAPAFSRSFADDFRVKRRMLSASSTFLPRIRSATRRTFCGDAFKNLSVAVASISISVTPSSSERWARRQAAPLQALTCYPASARPP